MCQHNLDNNNRYMDFTCWHLKGQNSSDGVLKKFLLWSNQSWPQFGCPVWLAQNISPSFCHQWPVFLQKLSRSLCCLLKLDWNDPHQCIPFVVRRQSYWQKSIKKETLQFASVYKTTSLALKRATQRSRKYVFAMKIKISIFWSYSSYCLTFSHYYRWSPL